MASSPRIQNANMDSDVMTTAQFTAVNDEIIRNITIVLRLAKLISNFKTGQALQFGNKTLDKTDFRNLVTQLKDVIRSQSKAYSRLSHHKKKKRKRCATDSFKTPAAVKENMREFFRNSNMGQFVEVRTVKKICTQVDKNTISETAVKRTDTGTLRTLDVNRLQVVNSGISASTILTSLLSLYVISNGLQRDPDNLNWITADHRMYEHFAQSFEELKAEDIAFRQTLPARTVTLSNGDKLNVDAGVKVSKDGNVIPIFDPTRFRFSDIQRIISKNRFSTEEVESGAIDGIVVDPNTGTTMGDMFRDPNLKGVLASDLEAVSDYLKGYSAARELDPAFMAAKERRKKLSKARKAQRDAASA